MNISETKVAEQLKLITDATSNVDIISSGIVKGINIYNYSVNILISYKENKFCSSKQIKEEIEKKLIEKFPKIKLKIDNNPNYSTHSEIPHILKLSELSKENGKNEDKWNMDSHKLFWHLDRVEKWQKGERIAPLHIDMGISNGCNMACTYCYGVIQNRSGFGTNQKKIFHMPKFAVKRFFKDAKDVGVRSIALIGEGENTLHPDFHEILEYGKSINIDLSLATNGINLNSKNADLLLTSLKWLRINISAGTYEGFEKIHRLDRKQMDRVLKNITDLAKIKKEKKYDCTLGFQMVVTKENFNEIVPLAKIGKECGVDYFVVKPCSDTYDHRLDAPTGEYIETLNTFKEAEKFANKDYAVNIKWKKAMNGGWKDYDYCMGTQFILGLSGTGNLFPCGHWFNERKDEFNLGNVIENSFKEILNSERYWEVQKKIRQTVNVNNDCESNCRQHYVNRFLFHEGNNTLDEIKIKNKDKITNKPNHINFI